MNKSTILAYQKHFSSRLSRRFPPFLAVRGGQTEREPTCLNVKLHAARFRVCVSLAAHIGGAALRRWQAASSRQCCGCKMDKGIFLVKSYISGLFLFGKVWQELNTVPWQTPCSKIYCIRAFFCSSLRSRNNFSPICLPDSSISKTANVPSHHHLRILINLLIRVQFLLSMDYLHNR